MTNTGRRFDHYSRREPEVFERFLNSFDQKPEFNGIKEALSKFQHHPDGIEDYDIRSEAERGDITFDTQESNNFARYGDVRIDYVSAYRPASYKTQSLAQFNRDKNSGIVQVDVWGKVVDPKAEFLVFEFPGARTFWQIYDLKALHNSLKELELTGKFRANQKFRESWGSAFLAVPETSQILQDAKPRNLEDILSRAKPRV